MSTSTDVVVLAHIEDDRRIAIPTELLPEGYRGDEELRVVAVMDRVGVLQRV
jgi:hypothetical protein